MVLENNKALLYLSSTGFQLYDVDGVASIHFNFPEGTVENASVVDGAKLKAEVQSLIEGESPKNKKGGEIAVVLAEDTIRQDLIDTISGVFEDAGWKAEMRSLPLAAQEITANKTLTPDLVRAILTGGHMAAQEEDKDSGVMKVEEAEPEVVTEKKVEEEVVSEEPIEVRPQPQHNLLDEVAAEASREGSGNMKKILLVILLLLLGAGLIFAGIKAADKFMGNSGEVEEELTEEILEETTPTPSPMPEASIEKSEVTVKILNGTGTPGQAGKAKTVMEDLGFEGVTAGNAPSKDATSTTVMFSSDIPQSLRDEIVEALDEVFDEVEQEEDEDAKMAITVTTGLEQEEVEQ